MATAPPRSLLAWSRDKLVRYSRKPNSLPIDCGTPQELAETIARNSPAAMRATKRALEGALAHRLTDSWGHPDQTEGPLAFAEKREPRWRDLDER